jgi:uncharacterized protein (TIGR02271 family)
MKWVDFGTSSSTQDSGSLAKKVLLPVGHCRVDVARRRVYTQLSKDQVNQLPEYHQNVTVNPDYEERVRSVYRQPTAETSVAVEDSLPVESEGRVMDVTTAQVPPYVAAPVNPPTPNRAPEPKPPVQHDLPVAEPPQSYIYDRDPDLYQLNDANHRHFRLYEERLIAAKQQQKTGEVTVNKRVETERANIAVPVEKEKVVVEVTNDRPMPVNAREAHFEEGEVARVDVYEETADIQKQAVVREEVSIRKEVQQDTVTVEDTVRHEELDIRRSGKPAIEERP